MSSELYICVAAAAAKLGKELGSRFPTAEVMDAFQIVYPQYWNERDTDANFDHHLKVLKTHYSHGKSFSTGERTFSTLTFMKNKLRNRLTTHLELVVGMKMQNFYTLDNFPYGDAYDSWAAEKKRRNIFVILSRC
jgi:uncharacterized protein YijF (DUF1287 family)